MRKDKAAYRSRVGWKGSVAFGFAHLGLQVVG